MENNLENYEENKPRAWEILTEEEVEILEEYFANGFKRKQAYMKFRDSHKNENSLRSAAGKFFRRDVIKQAIEERQEEILGTREQMTNELLHDLKYNIFERQVEGEYTIKDRQKDIELLIKIAGIDKAPKFKDDINQITSATQVVINILGGDDDDEF